MSPFGYSWQHLHEDDEKVKRRNALDPGLMP